MDVKSVKPDDLLMKAGECLMFLLWSETAMSDLVVLGEGDEDMCRRYSEAFGKAPHPRDFSRRRLELGRLGFSVIKDCFLHQWPKWKEHREIRDAIERIVIWRNGLGHANVQPFRGHLLYTPNKASWNQIRKYTRCHKCYQYHKHCDCRYEDIAEPYSITIRHQTLQTIYADIRTIDIECFYPTAVSLNIEYRGVAWLTEGGTYMLKETHSVRD